jgi:outer membrane translocation and assembly module TamA
MLNNFISEEQPLGFPRFGQVGMQLRAEQELRDSLSTKGFRVTATASYYPQLWDVKSPFGEVSALASTYFTFPFLTRPTLALRGGAKRVFGDAPYYEAAFVGGRRSLRALHRQRFAGDAALHGTSELRVPLLKLNYILPWNFGAIGFIEGGRVYQDGQSPGTWHSAKGYGGWIGLVNPNWSIQILRSNRPEKRLILGTGFAF